MKIPYDEFDLLMARFSIKIDDPEKAESVCQEAFALMPKSKAEFNEVVAAHNGISVVDLINSPNYKVLGSEYVESIIKIVVEKLKSDLGLTDVQAWSVAAESFGLVNF